MTKICKWGNSLGLRLPAPIAAAAGLKSGTRVGVRLLDNGSLLVTPLSGPVAANDEQRVIRHSQLIAKW